MRTIYNILTVALVCLCVSCESWLDVAPDGQIKQEDIFLSELTTEQYINSCYYEFPQYADKYGWVSNHPIALSDDAYETNNHYNNSPVKIYGGLKSTRDADNALIRVGNEITHGTMYGVASSWDLYYQNIRRCNTFLENVDAAPLRDEALRERYKGEIRILRAYYYMELFTCFREIPIFKNTLPDDFDQSTLQKSSVQEVAEFIIGECEDVIGNNASLPWRATSQGEKWRMTKGIASAIKSRVALFYASPLFSPNQDNWEYAKKVTKESLDELLSNNYHLYTNWKGGNYTSAYQEYYTSTYTAGNTPSDFETILVSKYDALGWNARGQMPPQVSPNYGRAGLCPTQQLVDAYPMANGDYVLDLNNPYRTRTVDGYVVLEPNYAQGSSYDPENPYSGRDPRFYATIIYNGAGLRQENGSPVTIDIYAGASSAISYGIVGRTYTGYYQRKWRHPEFTASGPNPSWRIFTLAELYLNYAEAAVESGDVSEALNAVEPIRSRVGMVNIPGGTKDQVRLYVRNERRIEFAYMDIRYMDLRRWGTTDQPMSEIRYPMGMWIEKDGDNWSYHRVPVGVVYNKLSGRMTGTQLVKLCDDGKYRLHPLSLEESNRLKERTGVNWQNPGW